MRLDVDTEFILVGTETMVSRSGSVVVTYDT